LSVSKIVSTMMMSAPPSMSPRVASRYAVSSSSNDTLRKPGLFTSGEIDAVAAGRAEHADHEARLVWSLRFGRIAAFARELGACDIEFVGKMFEVVVPPD